MDNRDSSSFRSFITSKDIRFELFSTPALFVLTTWALFWLYPFPNIYADTGAYIDAARTGLVGVYRPIGYSWFLAGVRWITPNPDLLVVLQQAFYFFSTLFLYLTLRFFFRQGPVWLWRIFFLLFLLAPACIYLSNFVISDSVFISLNNLWIASMLLFMGTRKTSAVILHALCLVGLLLVRFIALFYPFISIVALFVIFFKKYRLRFVLFSALQVAAFLGVIFYTIKETKYTTGIAVFSGFSGWQTANNAMHVVPHIKNRQTHIPNAELQKLHAFIIANTAAYMYPPTDSVIVYFLWSNDNPLKKYLYRLKGNNTKSYLHFWHQASIPLGKWGHYIIRNYPVEFFKYYIRPNFLLLFRLPNEALFIFPGPTPQMKTWFNCQNCAVMPRYPYFHEFLARTASPAFNILWILFGISLVVLMFPSKLNCSRTQYSMIMLVSFFCLTYIAMSVYASPLVLRYLLVIRHSLIMIPFLLFITIFPFKRNADI